MRPTESLLVNKGVGRGSSWSSLDLGTLESDVYGRAGWDKKNRLESVEATTVHQLVISSRACGDANIGSRLARTGPANFPEESTTTRKDVELKSMMSGDGVLDKCIFSECTAVAKSAFS